MKQRLCCSGLSLFGSRIYRSILLYSQYFMENTLFFFLNHFTDDNSLTQMVGSLTQVKPVNDVDKFEHFKCRQPGMRSYLWSFVLCTVFSDKCCQKRTCHMQFLWPDSKMLTGMFLVNVETN